MWAYKSSKLFFFEKKKQKTFASLDTLVGAGQLKEEEFFASFFKKEVLLS
jgi:hypothetical protein